MIMPGSIRECDVTEEPVSGLRRDQPAALTGLPPPPEVGRAVFLVYPWEEGFGLLSKGHNYLSARQEIFQLRPGGKEQIQVETFGNKQSIQAAQIGVFQIRQVDKSGEELSIFGMI